MHCDHKYIMRAVVFYGDQVYDSKAHKINNDNLNVSVSGHTTVHAN